MTNLRLKRTRAPRCVLTWPETISSSIHLTTYTFAHPRALVRMLTHQPAGWSSQWSHPRSRAHMHRHTQTVTRSNHEQFVLNSSVVKSHVRNDLVCRYLAFGTTCWNCKISTAPGLRGIMVRVKHHSPFFLSFPCVRTRPGDEMSCSSSSQRSVHYSVG